MSPSKAKAKSLTGHVDSTIEFGVALLFENDYGTSGMSGVSADIQDCYRKMMIGSLVPLRAQICMLLDQAAMVEDYEFRQQMSGGIGHMPPPTTPILSNELFNARLEFYRNEYFHGDQKSFETFFEGSVNNVFRYSIALGQ